MGSNPIFRATFILNGDFIINHRFFLAASNAGATPVRYGILDEGTWGKDDACIRYEQIPFLRKLYGKLQPAETKRDRFFYFRSF